MEPPRILAVTCLRNEGPYLVDWLAHHRALGLGEVLAYTNDCADGTDDLARALAPAGVIWRDNPAPPPGKSLQWQALRAAWAEPARKAADWLVALDVDEYINPQPPHASLGALLAAVAARCPGVEAVAMPWRLFGAAGQLWAEDAPVTQRFTRATPDPCAYPVLGNFVKTMFRSGPGLRGFGVHRPRVKPGHPLVWADGGGNTPGADFATQEARIALPARAGGRSLVQVNHYSLRSAEEFLLKRDRGLPNRKGKAIDAAYWLERNLNSVAEPSISRHMPAAVAERARLMALPGVADLHARAVAWHRSRFRAMMADMETWKLFGRLMMAPDSVLPASDALARYMSLRGRADG